MASSLKFVDSIASSPTTRLDLNDGTTWRLHVENTEFPPPPLNQAVASTLLADGGVIPSSAYGLRTIVLGLLVNAASADAVATQLQTLYRELNRSANILRWQHETTNPVFFRTFRTSASEVRDFGMFDGTWNRLLVEVLAEPFGYGLLETPVSAVTVNADPANGTNGCFVDVTGVKGDVESPAIIQWPVTGTGSTTLFATRRRGTPSGLPFLFQAEALTQGTDTTTQANDANFSGAGNNYSRCTFATATMQTRLSTDDIGTASTDLRGTYRVLVRYRKNTSGDGINLRLVWGNVSASATLVTNDTYATANTTSIVTADLGLIAVPMGNDPVADPSGAEVAVSDTFRLRLQAERTSGSGTIDFDFIALVPADDRLAFVQWSVNDGDHYVLDAGGTSVHLRDSSSRVLSGRAPAVVGGFPMLSPGETNRIYMIRNASPTFTWSLSSPTDVTVSYLPRYLSVRPAST